MGSSAADHGTPPSSAPSSPKSVSTASENNAEKDRRIAITPLSDPEADNISVVPVKKEAAATAASRGKKRRLSVEESAGLNNNSLGGGVLQNSLQLRQQLSSLDSYSIGYMQQYWQQQHQYLNSSSQYYQQQQQQQQLQPQEHYH